MTQQKYSRKDIKRFWSKVAVTDNPDDCWLWMRGLATGGYGQFSHNGRNRIASVVAWEIANGEKPAGMEVCHKCDNPRCCNPAHLFIGTRTDNMRDMAKKGRDKVSRERQRVEASMLSLGTKVKMKSRTADSKAAYTFSPSDGAVGVIIDRKFPTYLHYAIPHIYLIAFDGLPEGEWHHIDDFEVIT